MLEVDPTLADLEEDEDEDQAQEALTDGSSETRVTGVRTSGCLNAGSSDAQPARQTIETVAAFSRCTNRSSNRCAKGKVAILHGTRRVSRTSGVRVKHDQSVSDDNARVMTPGLETSRCSRHVP